MEMWSYTVIIKFFCDQFHCHYILYWYHFHILKLICKISGSAINLLYFHVSLILYWCNNSTGTLIIPGHIKNHRVVRNYWHTEDVIDLSEISLQSAHISSCIYWESSLVQLGNWPVRKNVWCVNFSVSLWNSTVPQSLSTLFSQNFHDTIISQRNIASLTYNGTPYYLHH